jgi:modulator of FtsH protease HflK
MYLDTMQQIYGSVTKVLVESRQGSSLLYLPLEKLLQMGNSGAALGEASGTAPTPTGVLPGPTPSNLSTSGDARSRDAARTRERDSR